ncbi:hypothetical protein VIGAN_08237800, partial [Vigna angularis var. angularis]
SFLSFRFYNSIFFYKNIELYNLKIVKKKRECTKKVIEVQEKTANVSPWESNFTKWTCVTANKVKSFPTSSNINIRRYNNIL